jgi:hypothetical protein
VYVYFLLGNGCDQPQQFANFAQLFALEDAFKRQARKARAVDVLFALQDGKFAFYRRSVCEGGRQATTERTEMAQGVLGGKGVPSFIENCLVGVAVHGSLERCRATDRLEQDAVLLLNLVNLTLAPCRDHHVSTRIQDLLDERARAHLG